MNCHAGWDVEQQDQEKSHISEATESYEQRCSCVGLIRPPRKSELTPQPGA
jgi:hypothetical protein